MSQKLIYTTHSAVPSDYEVEDGHLATALGVVNEEGALRPLLQPSQVLRLEQGSYVAYIHKTTAYTHYIINTEYKMVPDEQTGEPVRQDVKKIYWLDSKKISDLYPIDPDTGESTLVELFDYGDRKILGFNSVGNTLIILTDDGMYHFLWKSDNEQYLNLGNHMPELPISFGLQGTMYQNYSDDYDDKPDERETFKITYSEQDDDRKDIWKDDKFSEWGDAKKSSITSQVLAKVNKFIANRATNKGRFIFPFFVRYAYRLYDDSLTMHSAPILMAANTKCAPLVGVVDEDDPDQGRVDIGDTSATMLVVGMVHDLDYMIEGQNQGSSDPYKYLEKLKEWGDIIKSVDIFISAPIYTYDQSGECERFVNSYTRTKEDYGYCICQGKNSKIDTSAYQKWTISDYYDAAFGGEVIPQYHVELPNREDTAMEEIRDITNFYILKSIPLDELEAGTTRTKIDIEDDYLGSLVTRERMTDDYDSHDTLIPKYSFAYNSRLNIANLTKRLFEGYDAYSIFNYTYTGSSTSYGLTYYTHIRYEMTEVVVQQTNALNIDSGQPLLYFYYPSTNAYKVTFNYNGKYYEVALTASDFLNGAYAFVSFDSLLDDAEVVTDAPALTDNLVELPNKIYTSEVNNPYFFPLSGINTVGTGEIIGLCAAARALSQGQFGEFPLYAFCTDGVWALSVSAEGLYSAIQPITRDVCINTDSITQLDSQVLFATDRGIMLISGSELQCITDSLNSPSPFSPAQLPCAHGLELAYNALAPTELQLADINDLDMRPFLEFLATCRMVYDYIHQRIIVYNPDIRYAYVFSLKSQSWGMVLSGAFSSVNSYPDAMAMANVLVDNETIPALVDYSHPTDTSTPVLLVTRPFTLDSPDSLKTIRAVYQHGYFPRFKGSELGQVLYGTPDFFHWYVVASSVNHRLTGINGTPFRAFRLAVAALLDRTYTISNAEIEYDIRLANRIR